MTDSLLKMDAATEKILDGLFQLGYECMTFGFHRGLETMHSEVTNEPLGSSEAIALREKWEGTNFSTIAAVIDDLAHLFLDNLDGDSESS